jgi:lipopolysaccharide export system permease protein
MRILDRLVAATFLKLFVLSILATPPLFILGELTEDIDRYVDQGMTTLQVASAYVYKVPQYVVWSFPIAALIAAVFTVHGMTTHRETVAAKAGGISFHRLIAPILVIAVLLTGTALVLTEVAPRGNRIASSILEDDRRGRDWRSDFVYQTEGGLTLEARRFTLHDRRISGVVIHRRPTPDRPALYVQAASATWDSVAGWTLLNGTYRKVHDPETVASIQFQRLKLPQLTERPEELLQTTPEEEEMTYEELDRLAGIIERSGGEPHELRVKQEQKLAIPAATLVIILFGAPLATSSKRGGTAYGIGIALGTTILYIAMLKVSGAFGATGAISPTWGAWLPNVVFLLAGLSLMSRVRT